MPVESGTPPAIKKRDEFTREYDTYKPTREFTISKLKPINRSPKNRPHPRYKNHLPQASVHTSPSFAGRRNPKSKHYLTKTKPVV